jgi:hypothetical protein
MFFTRFKIDYALVGERDGLAGRRPDPGQWRKEAYRDGYAQGLVARAERIACGAAAQSAPHHSKAEART